MSDDRSKIAARRRSRALALLLAGVVLLASVPALALAREIPAAPRVGFAHPGAANETVVVNLTDTPSFSPSKIAVPSNSTVSLHLFNRGNFTHSFTLVALNQSNVTLPSSTTPSQLDRYFALNGSQANVSLGPNASGWANLSYPASDYPLSFEFVSQVAYQFQAGMYGFLNITPGGTAQTLYDNTTSSLSFVPALLSVTPPGPRIPTSVALQITNQGSFPHTFTLVAETNVSIPAVSYFNAHPPLVNASVNATDGFVAWANFTVPAPGIYEFVCTVPGHFQAGMYGFLYVGVPVPAPAPQPSTAVVEVGVLVGALVLFGIGAVLVLAAGFAGRFARPPRSQNGHH